MDNQNPQNSNATPPGNRPPPPPPRVPGSGSGSGLGAGQTPPSPPYQDSPAPPSPPQATYGDQRPGYASQAYSDAPSSQPQLSDQPAQYGGYGAPPPDQPAYPYGQGQQGQYYSPYPPARSGLPTWIWFAGGGALLAIIATVVTLVLVLGNKGTAATGPVVPIVPGGPGVQTPGTGLSTPGSNPSPITSGGESTPARAVEAFYSNLFAHNYDAAYALLTPDSRTQVGGVGALRNFWENIEAAARAQGITIEVQTSNEVIQGNNATVDVTITSSVGQGGTTTTPLQKIGNGWFLTGGVIGNVQP